MKMQPLLVAACLFVSSTTSFAQESVEKPIPRLGEWNKEVNDKIVHLGKVAAKPLAKVLQDENADLHRRINAALLLGKVGGNDVVGPLKVALSDKDMNVRFFATIALGDVGADASDAAPDLAKLLREQAKEGRLSVSRHQLIKK